jgi:hypothetical protein
MKRIILMLSVLVLIAISACNKSSSTSNASQFQWTYLGTTVQADSFGAYGPNSIVSYSEIDGYRGSISHPTDGFYIRINSLATGTYSNNASNTMTSWANGDNVSPFVVSITSNTGTMISGTFSGTYMNSSISGSFTNIPIH